MDEPKESISKLSKKELLAKLRYPIKKSEPGNPRALVTLSDLVNKEGEPEEISTEERVRNLMDKIISSRGSINEQVYAEGCDLLSEFSSRMFLFTNRWGTETYEEAIGLILLFWLHERKDNAASKFLQVELIKKLARRNRQDKDRIKDRPDRQDKEAFQAALLENIEEYSKSTIENAITKLLDKYPQFRKRRKETLRRWAKEVWPVPTKPGRPPKEKMG